MSTYLITGASRGLGLELVHQLTSFPFSKVSKIFAAARGESAELDQLASSSDRVVVIKLDVANEASIKQAAMEVESKLEGKGLDVLINNAGVAPWTPNGVKTMNDLAETFTVNVLGVHWVTQAFFPLLQKGTLKKIANITSTLGSITLAPYLFGQQFPAYKISKAALNALTVQYALNYEKEGFTIFALSPGWMRTDLGGKGAPLSVEQGAKASLEKIFGAGKEQSGKFLKVEIKELKKDGPGGYDEYDGSNAPW